MPHPTRPMKDRRGSSVGHVERTERSGGLAPPRLTNMRPRRRRGIQIPDERVSRGATPLAPTIRVGGFPSVSSDARFDLPPGIWRDLLPSPVEDDPEPPDLNVPIWPSNRL